MLAAVVQAKQLNIAWKQPVVVATTADIALSGLLTIDGVTVAAGDRVLVKNQATASQNGIYVAASGAWTRAEDFTTGRVITGTAVLVARGATQAGQIWRVATTGSIVVGVTSLAFAQAEGLLAGDVSGPFSANSVDFILGVESPDPGAIAEGDLVEAHNKVSLTLASPYSLVSDAAYLYVGQQSDVNPISPVVWRIGLAGASVTSTESVDLSVSLPSVVNVADLAQDATYLYAACWDAENIVIIDKVTMAVVGFAWVGAGERAVSVATDGSGVLFGTTSSDLVSWTVASCLGQPPSTVPPASTTAIGRGLVRYGGAKLWLVNLNSPNPTLRRYDPTTLTLEASSVETGRSFMCLYAFGSVWVTTRVGVNWRVSRYDPTTLALIASIPVTPNTIMLGLSTGPDASGTPDTQIYVTVDTPGSYAGIIDPNTDSWVGGINPGDPSETYAGVASIGQYVYFAAWEEGPSTVGVDYYDAVSTAGGPIVAAPVWQQRYRAMGGDVTGPVAASTVVGIRGVPVNVSAAAVLPYQGLVRSPAALEWVPGTTSVSISVASIALLAAADDSGLGDGAEAYTSDVRSLWVKRIEANPGAPTIDGITAIRNASDTATWYRTPLWQLWVQQTTWYVDQTSGLDTNDGSSGSPLATLQEVSRRTYGRPNASNMTINMIGNYSLPGTPTKFSCSSNLYGQETLVESTTVAAVTPFTRDGTAGGRQSVTPTSGGFVWDQTRLYKTTGSQSLWGFAVTMPGVPGGGGFPGTGACETKLFTAASVYANPIVGDTLESYTLSEIETNFEFDPGVTMSLFTCNIKDVTVIGGGRLYYGTSVVTGQTRVYRGLSDNNAAIVALRDWSFASQVVQFVGVGGSIKLREGASAGFWGTSFVQTASLAAEGNNTIMIAGDSTIVDSSVAYFYSGATVLSGNVEHRDLVEGSYAFSFYPRSRATFNETLYGFTPAGSSSARCVALMGSDVRLLYVSSWNPAAVIVDGNTPTWRVATTTPAPVQGLWSALPHTNAYFTGFLEEGN